MLNLVHKPAWNLLRLANALTVMPSLSWCVFDFCQTLEVIRRTLVNCLVPVNVFSSVFKWDAQDDGSGSLFAEASQSVSFTWGS